MRHDNIRKFKKGMILKRTLKKVFFLILMLIVVISILYSSGVISQNKLTSVVNKSFNSSVNDNVFPVLIDSDAKDIHNFNDNIFVITKKSGVFYNTSGEVIGDFEHGFKDPVVLVNFNYMITYDRNGKDIIISNSEKKYSKFELENDIINISIAPNGNIAVVTSSDDYECIITLYSKNLQRELYKYYSEDFITSIAFSKDSDFIYAIYLDVQNGIMNTNIITLNTKSEETNNEFEIKDDMGIDICVIDDMIIVVCKDFIYFINTKTKDLLNIEYNGNIVFFDINHNNKNIMLVNKTFKNDYEISLLSKTGQLISKNVIYSDILDVFNDTQKIVVLTKDVLYNYNYKLELLDTVNINQYTSKAIACNDEIFILGRNSIYKNNII